jgi:hypothetical protein
VAFDVQQPQFENGKQSAWASANYNYIGFNRLIGHECGLLDHLAGWPVSDRLAM